MSATKVLPLLCLLLLACGKSPLATKKKVNIPISQIPSFLMDQQVECASLNHGSCPEGVSRLFVVNPDDFTESALCSGFMISSKRMITNHHCISTQQQCDETYVSVYDGKDSISAKCRHLIAAEDDGPVLEKKSVDYAVLELDREIPLNHYFDEVKRRITPGEEVTVWVMDHVSLRTARVTELTCSLRRKLNSLELKQCPAIMGNSGSPVVNYRNEVVGVLWGTTFDERVTEDTPLELRRALNIFSYVTDAEYFKKFMD